MQGGAVLIPAPFPVCDGGPVLFPVFLSRFPCATGPRPVSRVRWGPVLFPCFCLVSRMQRVPAPFPVLPRFPCAMGACSVSRVSVTFPACSGFLPRFPFCPVSRVRWGPVLFPCFCLVSRMQRVPALFPRVQHGVPARSWCCRAFPRCLPNQVRSFSLVTFFSLRKESNKEVGRPMTFSRLPSMDSMMSSGCSWMA